MPDTASIELLNVETKKLVDRNAHGSFNLAANGRYKLYVVVNGDRHRLPPEFRGIGVPNNPADTMTGSDMFGNNPVVPIAATSSTSTTAATQQFAGGSQQTTIAWNALSLQQLRPGQQMMLTDQQMAMHLHSLQPGASASR